MGVLALGWSGLSTGCDHVGTGRGSWDGAIPAPGWGFWCSQGWGMGGSQQWGGGAQHRRIAPWRAAAAPWESLLSEHSPNGVAPLVPTPARPPARGNGRPGAARCRFGGGGKGEGGRASPPALIVGGAGGVSFLRKRSPRSRNNQSGTGTNTGADAAPQRRVGPIGGLPPPPTTTPHPSP